MLESPQRWLDSRLTLHNKLAYIELYLLSLRHNLRPVLITIKSPNYQDDP